jgi:hypothetical protein
VYSLVVRVKTSMKKSGVSRKRTKTRSRAKPRELVRARTLEEIWNTLCDGFQPAEDKLLEYLEAAYHGLRLKSFAVDDPDEQVRRRGSPHETISYGPPAWFEAPFCILKVFVREVNRDYMSHGGEEVLFNLPDSAGIEYEFFWPEGCPAPWSSVAENRVTVAPCQLIRISPSLPHRNRPVQQGNGEHGAGEAIAWIILRPVSLSPATVILHRRAGVRTEDMERPHHRLSETTLRQMTGAQFLLIASGLLEKLRVHRLRSEISVEELSVQSKLNRSYVGRLERLDFENFSVQTLYELSRQIDLDVLECLRQLRWAHHVQALPTMAESALASYEKPTQLGNHLFHPGMLRLTEGKSYKVKFLEEQSGEIVSVIMIDGKMVPGLPGESNVPVVEAGHVFHARSYPEFTIHALADMEALVIRYSQRCTCTNLMKEQQS